MAKINKETRRAVVRQDEEAKQHLEPGGRDGEEVDRD